VKKGSLNIVFFQRRGCGKGRNGGCLWYNQSENNWF